MLNVTTSTLSYNQSLGANGSGGGIHNNTGGDVTLMRSTISGNSSVGTGGGVYNNGDSFDINAVTMVLNTAGSTGGGIQADTNVSVKNTGVALNNAASGKDVSGTLTSNNYNLIGTDDLNVFAAQANDIEEADPRGGPLRDNGGVTFTHRLSPNSPAFDAGDPNDTFADQIGQPVFGASRDIGAYESQVTLTIDEFNDVSLVKMYPNPTKGNFNIVIDDNVTGNIEVKIISVTGKVVQELTLNNGVNNMDISGMSSGMYLVNIQTDNGVSTHRLILN